MKSWSYIGRFHTLEIYNIPTCRQGEINILKGAGVMTTLLELNNQIQAISRAFYELIEGRLELYRKADNEMFYSAQKVIFSNLKYVMRMPQFLDHDITGYDEKIQKAVNEARSLDSYSQINQFVWLKRHLRITRHYLQIHQQYMDDFNEWEQTLDRLIEEADKLPLSKAKTRLIHQAYSLQADIFTEMYGVGEIKPYEPIEGGTWLDVLIHSEFTINKHDALQFLTLNHDDPYTVKEINALPETLDHNGFEELVFVLRAESDSDCLFFNQYMQRMKRELKQNRELRQKAQEALQGTLGDIPTYSITTNEKGNIHSIKRNRPKLKLIHNKQ